jgi:hypothetical protein
VIFLHDPLDSSPDLLGPLQVAGGDSLLEFLQSLACALHRLLALRLLVAATLVGVDDEDAQVGTSRGDFLGAGARRIGLPFPGIDAARTVDPLRVVDGIEPGVELGVAAPLDPDEKSLLIFCKGLDVLIGDHAPVADEDDSTEREACAQVADDFLNRGMVNAVALPDMMGDGPTRDHHHADNHLHVLRRAIAAVAVLGEVVRTRALEVRTGDVVEDQLGLEAEKVVETVVQRHFDPIFGGEELVEGAVPGVELARMDANPAALVPVGEEASSLAVADEVGLEPAGEPVLAGRGDEPVGDEHEGAVGERDTFGSPEVLVEDGPEAQLVEQDADDDDRPPIRGIADVGISRIAGLARGFSGEESAELGEDRDEEVLASEIDDDTLLDLAVFAVGFDDADIFVDGAAGGADFHGSRVHENHYHDGSW